ncbi:MAG: metallophosphoesterase [Bryobacteraceae bacterium]
MQRRDFLATSIAASAAAASAAAAQNARFSFIHLTDLHIQPELRASEGCRMCFDHARKTKADFALLGGDLVFDVMNQKHERAKLLYGMFAESSKRLEMPLYSTPGNHDVFGWNKASAVPEDDPGYGKKMFEDKMGPRYRSFDHKGWHFVTLDSVQAIRTEPFFEGSIDAGQLAWLKDDLAKAGAGTPVIVMTHIPLVTGAAQILQAKTPTASLQISNSKEVLEVLWKHDVKMVLQGHTHICERVEYNGCQFITSGAVSGNWWRGKRLFDAEGYGLIEVSGGRAAWSYRTYGFQAEAV